MDRPPAEFFDSMVAKAKELAALNGEETLFGIFHMSMGNLLDYHEAEFEVLIENDELIINRVKDSDGLEKVK